MYSGSISTCKFTDGTITINKGTLSCSADKGFIEANIGSFTNLYAHDLFIADDMVVNGNTTYLNSSQTSFEDELISKLSSPFLELSFRLIASIEF